MLIKAAIRYNLKPIVVAKFKIDDIKFGGNFEAEDLLYTTRSGAHDGDCKIPSFAKAKLKDMLIIFSKLEDALTLYLIILFSSLGVYCSSKIKSCGRMNIV